MDEFEKVNLLVVDDLPDKLVVYRTMLEELGQNVITARSGAEALKKVLQDDFAVILLDVNMPIMDGFETASLLRKRKKSAHTPIIFVTSFLDDVRPIQGYAHGAVDYIMAPVAPEILRAKVKVFVDLFRMHRQVKRQAEERIALAEERAKRAAAEEANRRSAFLAEASRVLASSLDLDAVLNGLARLSVSFLADLSIICLADENGRPSETQWAWIDAAEDTIIQTHAHGPPQGGSLASAIEQALLTGQLQLLPELETSESTAAFAPSVAATPSAVAHPGLELKSAVVLPLAARGKTIGVLALALASSGPNRRPSDLALLEDLACRAGIAIDNARLVRNIQDDDRRKDEFLAMLAHELRNPLAPIRNAVHVMRLIGSLSPELQRARDMIDRQVRQLVRLVDDLLDVSRITRGKIALQLKSVDVATVVASAVETSRPLIESRKHELHLAIPQEPIRVRADADRLAQILSNLLNNAAKYTTECGQIWLCVGREDNEIIFRVRDNGMGIPRDMLRTVFDLFTQVDRSLGRSQGGLGIGLTLVRRLVEMHQGTVQAFSQGPGHGSELVVRLPCLPDVQERTPAAESPLSSDVPEELARC